MRVEYWSFLKKLQDAQFAKGFLTLCFHEGYVIGDVRHPDEIEGLPEPLAVKISEAIFPFYYMEKTPRLTYWLH